MIGGDLGTLEKLTPQQLAHQYSLEDILLEIHLTEDYLTYYGDDERARAFLDQLKQAASLF